ncbi:hypothetical protein LCGC14_2056180, partial [marine sediment metagenome]
MGGEIGPESVKVVVDPGEEAPFLLFLRRRHAGQDQGVILEVEDQGGELGAECGGVALPGALQGVGDEADQIAMLGCGDGPCGGVVEVLGTVVCQEVIGVDLDLDVLGGGPGFDGGEDQGQAGEEDIEPKEQGADVLAVRLEDFDRIQGVGDFAPEGGPELLELLQSGREVRHGPLLDLTGWRPFGLGARPDELAEDLVRLFLEGLGNVLAGVVLPEYPGGELVQGDKEDLG